MLRAVAIFAFSVSLTLIKAQAQGILEHSLASQVSGVAFMGYQRVGLDGEGCSLARCEYLPRVLNQWPLS